MRKPIAASVLLAAAALLLSACDSNNGTPPNTVSAFAAQDVDKATCADNPPQEINGTAFVADDSTTDVNSLVPGCL